MARRKVVGTRRFPVRANSRRGSLRTLRRPPHSAEASSYRIPRAAGEVTAARPYVVEPVEGSTPDGRPVAHVVAVDLGIKSTTPQRLAQIGTAGGGGRGLLSAGTLEMSNVDLAEEFTRLIVAQRGFQGNARVVTTADEILQEVVNLRR